MVVPPAPTTYSTSSPTRARAGWVGSKPGQGAGNVGPGDWGAGGGVVLQPLQVVQVQGRNNGPCSDLGQCDLDRFVRGKHKKQVC